MRNNRINMCGILQGVCKPKEDMTLNQLELYGYAPFLAIGRGIPRNDHRTA
jgi:hypothetical protein